MNTVDVTLSLPEELVEEAKKTGVLTDERVAALIEAEVKRQTQLQRFKSKLKQIQALEPVVTQEEIDLELDAYYDEQAEKHKRQS